jgi:hypothetical protein
MSKYYTPTIEEFHVGFEYKLPQGDVITVEETTDLFSIAEYLDMNTGIKVKYLDRDDIESLGFKYNEFYSRGFYGYTNTNQNLMIAHQFIDNPEDVTKVTILKNNLTRHLGRTYIGSLWEPIFVGTIKSKSELKKVLKQISYEH